MQIRTVLLALLASTAIAAPADRGAAEAAVAHSAPPAGCGNCTDLGPTKKHHSKTHTGHHSKATAAALEKRATTQSQGSSTIRSLSTASAHPTVISRSAGSVLLHSDPSSTASNPSASAKTKSVQSGRNAASTTKSKPPKSSSNASFTTQSKQPRSSNASATTHAKKSQSGNPSATSKSKQPKSSNPSVTTRSKQPKSSNPSNTKKSNSAGATQSSSA